MHRDRPPRRSAGCASEWYGSVTSTTSSSPAADSCRAAASSDSYVVLPWSSRMIAVVGHAVIDQVAGRRLGLGEAIARLVAAGHHDHRRDAVVPQIERRGRAWRRAAVTVDRRTAPRRARRSPRPDRVRCRASGAHHLEQRDQVVGEQRPPRHTREARRSTTSSPRPAGAGDRVGPPRRGSLTPSGGRARRRPSVMTDRASAAVESRSATRRGP